MTQASNVTDNYGPAPSIDQAVFYAGTATTMYIEMTGTDGASLTTPTQVTVPTTVGGTHIYTILATAGVTWKRGFLGMRVFSNATSPAYFNYGGSLKDNESGASPSYTASITTAPSANGYVIPVDNFQSAPYLIGRVAG